MKKFPIVCVCVIAAAAISTAEVCSGCKEKQSAGVTDEQEPPQEIQLEVMKSIMGSLILTRDNQLLKFHLADETLEVIYSFSRPVTYVVPLRRTHSFVVIDADKTAHDMTLSTFFPSRSEQVLIHRYKKIGLPVLSPDASELAWVAESKSGTISLYVAPINDLSNPLTLGGEFMIDNTGPRWHARAKRKRTFIVALKDRRIGEVTLGSTEVKQICDGELPVLVPNGERLVLSRENEIWIRELASRKESRLITVEYINTYYRACQVCPEGRFLVFRTLIPRRLGASHLTKCMLSLLLIDLETTTKRDLVELAELQGPWAWLPD